jgi:hypothetical protein
MDQKLTVHQTKIRGENGELYNEFINHIQSMILRGTLANFRIVVPKFMECINEFYE